jgi:hypothetical protein
MTTAQPTKKRHLALLLAAMLVLALAPIAGLVAWQTYDRLHQEQERTQQDLQRAATDFANSVQRELGSSIDALTVLSQSEIFQHGRITAMGRLLQGRPRRDWDSIFLLDPQGAVVLDTAAGKPAPAQALHAIHAKAMIALAPVVSDAGGARPGIAIAMPINQGGHIIYVLGVRLNDTVWARLAGNAVTPEGAQARLYDANRKLISQSAAMATATMMDDGRVYDACADAPPARWNACVAVPAEPLDAQRRDTVLHALKTSGVALLLGFVLAAAIGRAVLARVD